MLLKILLVPKISNPLSKDLSFFLTLSGQPDSAVITRAKVRDSPLHELPKTQQSLHILLNLPSSQLIRTTPWTNGKHILPNLHKLSNCSAGYDLSADVANSLPSVAFISKASSSHVSVLCDCKMRGGSIFGPQPKRSTES